MDIDKYYKESMEKIDNLTDNEFNNLLKEAGVEVDEQYYDNDIDFLKCAYGDIKLVQGSLQGDYWSNQDKVDEIMQVLSDMQHDLRWIIDFMKKNNIKFNEMGDN